MDKIVSLQTHDGASSVHSCMDILSYIVPYVYDIDVLDAHHLDRLSSLIKRTYSMKLIVAEEIVFLSTCLVVDCCVHYSVISTPKMAKDFSNSPRMYSRSFMRCSLLLMEI